MATITGLTQHVGQIVKQVEATYSGSSGTHDVTGPVFELFHKKEVTVAILNVSGQSIKDIQLMRVFSNGTASQESISSDAVTAGNGVTFAVSYNVPKFRIDYKIDKTTSGSSPSTVLIEVEGGY